MAIEVTVRTADLDDDGTGNDDPIEKETACHVDVTGLDAYNATDNSQRVYRMRITGPGDDLVSHVFTPSQDGKHTWDNLMFPDDGSFSLKVWLLDDEGAEDSAVKTQAITVVART